MSVSSVLSLSCVRLFVTPWTAACHASLSCTISQNLLKLTSIESMMPSNRLILCRPLLLPSIFPSIRVFSNEMILCIRWPKYFQDWFPLELTGLISFQSKGLSRVFSNTTVQNINSSVLSFLYVQLSHPYVTTGNTIALTRQIFVGKVMSLLLTCCLGWS